MKVYGSHMTQEQAQGLFDELAANCFSVSLHFSYHEQMMPAENYSVVVHPGVGAFQGVRLVELIEIAERHSCDVTLIDSGLRLFPYMEARS